MLSLERLSKSYGRKALFNEITYQFPAGERVALVGANGAGKTTLLNILCGLEEADSGNIVRAASIEVGYLPQEPNPTPLPTVLDECMDGARRLKRLKASMDALSAGFSDAFSEEAFAKFETAERAFRDAGGYAWESRAKGLLMGLGFKAAQLCASPADLSGGWRMRLELARLLLNEPNFLVLDEPTNHLDLPSLVWVERFLARFQGTVLFVSHDRTLLNRLATIVLHLHAARLTPYAGNFDDFLVERERRAETAEAQREQLRKKRESLEVFVERFGAKASKAKQAQSKAKAIERLRALEEGLQTDADASEVNFNFPDPPASGRDALVIEDGAIGYGATTLATGIQLRVQRGMKVAVIGANGIGKSTLLKTISGRIEAKGGSFRLGHNAQLSYFAQNALDELDPEATPLASVLSGSAEVTERQARALLGGFLFRGDEVFKRVGVLSGGEKSRVALARLLVSRSNLLLLDEPTNHLDMSSAEILSEAVSSFAGTVLFVSHDREFIDSTCTHVLAMLPDGRSHLFEGKLEDYERMCTVSGFPNVLASEQDPGKTPEASGNVKATSGPAHAEGRRERQKAERKVAKLEQELESLGVQAREATAALEQCDPTDYKKIGELHRAQVLAKEALCAKEEEWLAAAAELENG